MAHILFFKTKSMEDSRNFLTLIFDTVEEAIAKRQEIIEKGYANESIIYTAIKEGIK